MTQTSETEPRDLLRTLLTEDTLKAASLFRDKLIEIAGDRIKVVQCMDALRAVLYK